jgi:hypothetical protein
MKFSLASQNLEAGLPLPVSSASCPAAPTFDPTTKGLIGVGVVLGVLVLVLSLYTLYRWCRKSRRAHQEPRDTPTIAKPPPGDGVEPKKPVILVEQQQSVPNPLDFDSIGPKGPVTVNSPPLPSSKSPPSGPPSGKAGGGRAKFA